MLHPFLDKAWKIVTYILIWIFFSFLHFYVLNHVLELDLTISIVDSIVTYFILSVLYVGIWYYIRYIRVEETKLWKVVVYILITGLIIVFFWILLDWLSMLFILDDKDVFSAKFDKIILFKASYGIILYIFVTMDYYLITYYQNYQENVERKNELSVLLANAELANLKSQINPHFLFNSLNSISYLIYSSPDDAHNSIVKLSDYFRYTLSKSNDKFTSLKDELGNIFRYLDIEKIRFTDKMKVTKNIDDECLKNKLPVMILQPLVENAVKHGVYESTELIEIEIIARDYEDFFVVEIINDYSKDFKNNKGTSTGLKNVARRLVLTYEREDLLKVIKTENKFNIKIKFPKDIDYDKK